MFLALFSIKPTYSQQILSGQKSVEFRRTMPNSSVRYIVIYESSPTQKIVGLAKIRKFVSGSPRQIWEQYFKVGGISETAFFEYYRESLTAYAIELENVISLEPISLDDAGLSKRPPQSFCYIHDQDDIDRILSMAKMQMVS